MDVVRSGLGVLDVDVDEPVVVEDSRIEQLVLEVRATSGGVGAEQVGVRVLAERIPVPVLEVGAGRRGVEVEVGPPSRPHRGCPRSWSDRTSAPSGSDRRRSTRRTPGTAAGGRRRCRRSRPRPTWSGPRAGLVVAGVAPTRHRSRCRPPAPCPTDARSGTGPHAFQATPLRASPTAALPLPQSHRLQSSRRAARLLHVAASPSRRPIIPGLIVGPDTVTGASADRTGRGGLADPPPSGEGPVHGVELRTERVDVSRHCPNRYALGSRLRCRRGHGKFERRHDPRRRRTVTMVFECWTTSTRRPKQARSTSRMWRWSTRATRGR